MSGTMSNRCSWYRDYGADQWAFVWLTLRSHALEQVDAAKRHSLPVNRDGQRILEPPELRRPLDPQLLASQVEREIQEGLHDSPKKGVSLYEAVRAIFDGAFLRAYLDALPEPDFTRLYKLLLVRALQLIRWSRAGGWGAGSKADLQAQAEDLLQEVLWRACAGKRPWPRRGQDLVPLVPFLVQVMKSVASHERARGGPLTVRYDREDELERISLSRIDRSAEAPPSPNEVIQMKQLALAYLGGLSGNRLEALHLFLRGKTAKEIHAQLCTPLSTVHRWIRDLVDEILVAMSEPPYVDTKEL